MDGTKERLIQFIAHLGLDKSVFEREAGLANGFVDKTNSHMRKTSISAITNRWPQLNADWLTTGQGEMLREIQLPKSDSISNLIERIDRLIEVQERQAKNTERLLELILQREADAPKKKTSSM